MAMLNQLSVILTVMIIFHSCVELSNGSNTYQSQLQCPDLEIISSVNLQPSSPITNARLEVSLDFKSGSGICRATNVTFEFKSDKTKDKVFQNVHSVPHRVNKGLSFVTKVVGSTSYLIIDPWTKDYTGEYRFVVQDLFKTVNRTFWLESLANSNGINSETEDVTPPCYLPHVKNITAVPLTISGNIQTIQLQWELTKKEDPNLKYCKGSRRCKVRILKYSNIAAVPGDYEVVDDSTIEWTIVTGRNHFHSFTGQFSPDEYYSFQVGHLEKFFGDEDEQDNDVDNSDSVKPLVFASQIYFFGKQVSASIYRPPDSIIRLQYGSSRSVHCDAEGFPTPNAKWIRESGGIPTIRQNNSAILELNHVTKQDEGVYYCVAFNVLVNPPNGRRDEVDTWKIIVEVEDNDILKTGVSCRTLTLDSSVCKSYIYTGLEIFTDHATNETSIERENRAIMLTSVINYNIPLGVCRNLAYSMMCHNVYPYCDAVPGLPTPRKLCKNVCEEFISGKCKGYLSKGNPLYEMLVEGCNDEYTGGQAPECIPLSYQTYRNDQFESIEDTGDCIRGDGRGYSGNEYRTVSGALCQSWTKQTPHRHPMLPELYKTDLDQAHFSCRNPGGIGISPWCYTSDPSIRWEYCSIPKCDSCERYKGETCKSLEEYSNTNVTIKRTKQLQSQEAIEEKISLFSKSVLFLQPTDGCKNILKVLLCHGAFPQCTEMANKQPCSVHCQFEQALRNHCPSVYAEFSKFMIANRYFLNKADCSLKEEEQCMAINTMTKADAMQDMEANLKDKCYEGNGMAYNGTVSQTRDGIPCQAWDSQRPHSHPITPEKYPELQNAKNHCRNPGNLKEKPWCYTARTDKLWEYCEIEHCDSFKEFPKNEINQEPFDTDSLIDTNQQQGNTSGAIIATMSIVVTVLIVLMGVAFTGCYCFLSRKNRRAKAILETEFRLSKMTREAFEGEKYVTNADYTKVPAANRSQSLLIPENFTLLNSKDIKYVSQLGQGNFGIVFKGKAFGIKRGVEDDEEGIDVAVKTLKEEASSEVKQDFIDEAKLMFTFDHPNILKIHGVCMNEMPYQLVFEYMDEGDLTKFLRSRASSHQRRLINPFSYRSRTESSYSDDPASLTKTELLYICKQIADGMKYLAENKHVHRDLACRNCLIKSDLVVKIGDFGMSRNLYSKDYYRINGNAVLPVRWMSPESLIYGKFSVEGDVWSFGVVMWEVFSFALQPYYGVTNEEVTEAIRRGKTLNRPDDCPIEIYRLMKECWTMDPADRITFPELWSTLLALHHSSSVSGSPDERNHDTISETSFDIPSDTFLSEEDQSEDSANSQPHGISLITAV